MKTVLEKRNADEICVRLNYSVSEVEFEIMVTGYELELICATN